MSEYIDSVVVDCDISRLEVRSMRHLLCPASVSSRLIIDFKPSSYEGRTVDALAPEPTKDAITCDKPRGVGDKR